MRLRFARYLLIVMSLSQGCRRIQLTIVGQIGEELDTVMNKQGGVVMSC